AEPSIIRHMNEDHADAVQRIAGRTHGSGRDWRMTGIDPEGADFRSGGKITRALFRAQIRDAGAGRSGLVHLARAGGPTPAGRSRRGFPNDAGINVRVWSDPIAASFAAFIGNESPGPRWHLRGSIGAESGVGALTKR